ncbi:MAG: PorV/PorQ family protein [Candidatus Zixiibacteriota bacterium]
MKRSCHLAIVLTALVLAPVVSLVAGDAGRESQFSIGSGARALGMGGGFVGLGDDASAIFWNQAALTLLDQQEFNLMHLSLFEGSIYDVISYVYPHERFGGFGVSFMRLGTGDILKRRDWREMGEFSYFTWQMLFGYGRRLEGGFAVGSALKIVNQTMDNSSSYGAGLDISFYRNLYRYLNAGITFQDIISPKLRIGEESEVTPTTVILGIGVKEYPLGRDLYHNLGISLEKPEERSLKIRMGVETVYRRTLSLRAGYDRDNFTFGLGFQYQRLRLDYGYKFLDGLDDSHRLGLSFKVGMSVSEKIQRQKELESARGSTLILDDRRRQFQFYKELADKYYRSNAIDSAYVYYQRSLAYNENDRDVRNRIDHIDDMRRMISERAQKELVQREMTQPILDSYHSQAETFYKKGSYAAALDIINIGLGISPDNQRFIELRNHVFEARDSEIRRMMDNAARAEREGRYADAVTYYNRVMELSPGNVAVKQLIARDGTILNNAQLISKGAELYALGNLSDAKARFEEVLKSDPNNLVAQDYLNRILTEMKEATELEDLQKDDRVWKIYLEALEHFRNADYEKAILLWQEVLKYYPGNKNTINNIEQARLRMQGKE